MSDKKENHRVLSLRLSSDGTPATLNEEDRSVDVLASTENPVEIFDYDRWETVNEVLLMSGCRVPGNGKIPLLDSHHRQDSSSVIGSFRNIKKENGELTGKAHFSSTIDAESQWVKIREGHLTDFSIGYRVDKSTWIDDGQKAVVDGREFSGPLKVVTDWKVRELSVCPIGADEMAKARAAIPPKTKEKDSMDTKLRAFLERRGLAKDATEEEAYLFLEKLDVRKEKTEPKTEPKKEPKVEHVDVDSIRKVERERISTIVAMGNRFDCADIADELVKEGKSVDEARERIMDKLIEGETSPGHRKPAEVGTDEREKFRAAAEGSILMRAGRGQESPAEGSQELTGFSLVELARESLLRSGRSHRGGKMEMVGRALTTSDFPYILANAANKSLAEGFEKQDESWSQWCSTGSVSDFKENTTPRASETDDLDEIPEGTEYKYGTREEAKEAYQIATYGKMFAITRQTIVNDDLSALTDIPANHGESAARKIGDIAYAVLTANSAMGDGVALFHATHSNLPTAGAPGVTTLAAAILAMGTQKDIKLKRRLNITPEFFLAPKALEGATEVFFRSERWDATNKAATTINPYSGTYFKRIYEARLDDDSTTAWYLATTPRKTVKVFFLDGIQSPYMETREGFSVDGVEYKVRIDAGAKALDWRGLLKNAGA